MDNTKIEWADSTFNPWIGCTKISPACDNCYAEALMDKRMHRAEWGTGKPRARTNAANWRQPIVWNTKQFYECECGWRGDAIVEHSEACNYPNIGRTKTARRRVFCASLADVFDNEVDLDWLIDLFDLIRITPNLDWLLLTKRIGRVTGDIDHAIRRVNVCQKGEALFYWLRSWQSGRAPSNVWLGSTICNQPEADRDIFKLLSTPAAVRFISFEPMLSGIDITDLPMPNTTRRYDAVNGLNDKGVAVFDRGIDWAIAGGETGASARPMHINWARSLREQCADNVAFLFKQWGDWAPRSACYHTLTIGRAAADIDPGATKWPCIRLTESGGNGTNLANIDGGDDCYMQKVGKRLAGRLLDGVEHNGYPEVNNV